MNIELLETEQNYQNETTTVWFSVDEKNYGVCFEMEPTCGYSFESYATGYHAKMLDGDGCPEVIGNAALQEIWGALLPMAEAEIS